MRTQGKVTHLDIAHPANDARYQFAIFGAAPFAVAATASSSLTPSYSIVSGPATLSGSTVTLTGAGTVVVRTSQAGDGNFTAATPVDQSFTVAKATLTVTADAKSRIYGDANPTLTATISGYVNSELRLPQNEDNGNGLMVLALGGPWRADLVDAQGDSLRGARAFMLGDVLSQTTKQGLNRFINSVSAQWSPTTWLATRAAIGSDLPRAAPPRLTASARMATARFMPTSNTSRVLASLPYLPSCRRYGP